MKHTSKPKIMLYTEKVTSVMWWDGNEMEE